jgi:hypothetical protein
VKSRRSGESATSRASEPRRAFAATCETPRSRAERDRATRCGGWPIGVIASAQRQVDGSDRIDASRFLARETGTRTIVDRFCGHRTVLAVARRARKLTVDFTA